MALTPGQTQEAIGRAGLVYELLAVEDRMRRVRLSIDELREKKQAAEHLAAGELGDESDQREVDVLAAAIADRTEELERLGARTIEISETLWGEGAVAGEVGWQEEIENMSRERALVAIETLCRIRPEFTPPNDVDGSPIDTLVAWLIEKGKQLDDEELEAWTR